MKKISDKQKIKELSIILYALACSVHDGYLLCNSCGEKYYYTKEENDQNALKLFVKNILHRKICIVNDANKILKED